MYEIFLVSVRCKGVVWCKWKDNIKMEKNGIGLVMGVV